MATEGKQAYKIKRIDFLSRRNVPIVLQNENGPCPLLAISNVLLLRNNINMHPDAPEISLEDLLSLVAHRLLDSNLSSAGNDDSYAKNQQQNVSDVIAMLPRLATGIDVNVRFRNIHDFEFTPETAIFDLLDISLVHGWLVDPQDDLTTKAVGSQSYNTLVEKLVDLHSSRFSEPSSSLAAKASSEPVPSEGVAVNSDFSKNGEGPTVRMTSFNPVNWEHMDNATADSLIHEDDVDRIAKAAGLLQDEDDDDDDDEDRPSLAAIGRAESSATMLHEGSVDALSRVLKAQQLDEGNDNDSEAAFPRGEKSIFVASDDTKEKHESHIDPWEKIPNTGPTPGKPRATGGVKPPKNDSFLDEEPDDEDLDEEEDNVALKPDETSDVQPSLRVWLSEGETMADRVRLSEPHMRTVEEESTMPTLSEAGRSPQWRAQEQQNIDECNPREDEVKASDEELTEATKEAILSDNFLSSTASQLTYHGLFSLQEGIKERELCVFFRNNHFSTMFKYEGSLYLLATDQGYYNQSNLVWERLSEVEGDNQFCTGDFHIFHAESIPRSWAEEDEAAIVAAATRDQVGGAGVQENDYNSDLQLALALQQQEMDEQRRHQRQQQQHQHQQHQHQHQHQNQHQLQQQQQQQSAGVSKGRPLRVPSSSQRLVVGPTWPPTAAAAARVDERDRKSGSNCVVM